MRIGRMPHVAMVARFQAKMSLPRRQKPGDLVPHFHFIHPAGRLSLRPNTQNLTPAFALDYTSLDNYHPNGKVNKEI